MAAMMQGLNAEAYDRQYEDRELVRRIVAYFRPHRWRVIVIAFCVFLLALTGAALPLLTAQGVNVLAVTGDTSQIPWLIGIVFAIGVGTWGFNWVRRLLTTQVIADVVMQMREDGFNAAAYQDLSFFDEFSTGRIVSRITSDTEEFGQIIVLAADVIQQLFVAVILVATLFSVEWRLTLAVLVMAPFVVAAALGFRRLARNATRQGSRAMGEVNKAIQEAVTGIAVAKNFRQEQASTTTLPTSMPNPIPSTCGAVSSWPISFPPSTSSPVLARPFWSILVV